MAFAINGRHLTGDIPFGVAREEYHNGRQIDRRNPEFVAEGNGRFDFLIVL